jgi:uncharacterized membrane protein YqjE
MRKMMKVAQVEGQDGLTGPNESVWPFVALLAGCAVAGAAFGFVVLALFQASALVAMVLGVMTALALVLFAVFKAEYPLGEAYAVAGSMFAGLCLVSAFAYLRFELPATERAELASAMYKQLATDGNVSLAEEFRTWSATTVADGVAVQWSGADSEILWVQPVFGTLRVWARSPGRQYFFVEAFLDEGGPVAGAAGQNVFKVKFGSPQRQTEGQFVETIVQWGRADLVKKWRLPERPA